MKKKNGHRFWRLAPLLFLGLSCSPAGPSSPALPVLDAPVLHRQGAVLYQQRCFACHLAGQGGALFPALKGSSAVSGDPAGLIRVIVKGQQGVSVVNGRKLNGIMPAQGYLTDVEIASICTYIRREFAGIEVPVQPFEVAAARK